jgi:glycosyltransferase involved in cell wall biosynthesis
MRIGIDARLYGLEHAGIGRYVMNLVDRLITDTSNQWVLFVAPHYVSHFSQYKHVECIETSIRHYSFAEQFQFVQTLNQAKLDLLHVPHFNVPVLYHRPFVVTIHDILWHQVRGGSVTTLSPVVYYLKYVGYLLTVRHAVTASKAIFVPSNFVKSQLLQSFKNIKESKVHVTYEGIDKKDNAQLKAVSSNPPSIVYVGSAYPHKNLTVLFRAVKWLKDVRGIPTQITIVGSRSVFLDKVKADVEHLGMQSYCHFAGYQSDSAIKELFRRSLCLVHPSRSEGFGLTGLEAMAAGVPVLAAKSTALPEVYGDAAIFFAPDDYIELSEYIEMLIKQPLIRDQLIQKGYQQIRRFSWDDMVQQTKEVYSKV